MLMLHPHLCKGNPAAVGEQVGGQYAHRIQIGYEKDNSPKYQYFKTEDEYKTYLENKAKKKKKPGDKKSPVDKKKDLKEKLTAEQKKNKDKETGKEFSRRGKLFVKDKKKKTKISKSIGLFIGV